MAQQILTPVKLRALSAVTYAKADHKAGDEFTAENEAHADALVAVGKAERVLNRPQGYNRRDMRAQKRVMAVTPEAVAVSDFDAAASAPSDV